MQLPNNGDIDIVRLSSGSMEPTLSLGAYLSVEKSQKTISLPGELVLFWNSPAKTRPLLYIRRVIAVENSVCTH